MFFDPNDYKTPSILNPNNPATAIPVRADFQHDVNTPKVTHGKAVTIHWGLLGENGPGTVIRQSYFIEATTNDEKAKSAFAGTCKALGYTVPLVSLEQVDEWLSGMVATANPVTLILEPDGKDENGDPSRYSRVKYVNKSDSGVTGATIRSDYSDLLEQMSAKADASFQRTQAAASASDGDLENAIGVGSGL